MFVQRCRQRKTQNTAFFLSLKIWTKWKRSLKRQGGPADGFSNLMRSNMKNQFSLQATSKMATYEKRIRKMLFGFLLKELIIYTLIDKGREFALRIEYMQKRLRDKHATKDDGKVEVLVNRWDLLLA